jgi:hypothetical protein
MALFVVASILIGGILSIATHSNMILKKTHSNTRTLLYISLSVVDRETTGRFLLLQDTKFPHKSLIPSVIKATTVTIAIYIQVLIGHEQ